MIRLGVVAAEMLGFAYARSHHCVPYVSFSIDTCRKRYFLESQISHQLNLVVAVKTRSGTMRVGRSSWWGLDGFALVT